MPSGALQSDIQALLQPGHTPAPLLEVFHDVELKSDAVGCGHRAYRGALFVVNCRAASETRNGRTQQEQCRAILTGAQDNAAKANDRHDNKNHTDRNFNTEAHGKHVGDMTSPTAYTATSEAAFYPPLNEHITVEGSDVPLSYTAMVTTDAATVDLVKEATQHSAAQRGHSVSRASEQRAPAALEDAPRQQTSHSSWVTSTCFLVWITYNYLSAHLPHLMPITDDHAGNTNAAHAGGTRSAKSGEGGAGSYLNEKQMASLSKVAVWPDEKELKGSCHTPVVAAASADSSGRADATEHGQESMTPDTKDAPTNRHAEGKRDGADGGGAMKRESSPASTAATDAIVIRGSDVVGVEIVSSSVTNASVQGRSATLLVLRSVPPNKEDHPGDEVAPRALPEAIDPGFDRALPDDEAGIIHVVASENVKEHSFWFLRGGSVRFVKTIQAARPDLASDVQVELPSSTSTLSSPVTSPISPIKDMVSIKKSAPPPTTAGAPTNAAGSSLGGVMFRIQDSSSAPGPSSSKRSSLRTGSGGHKSPYMDDAAVTTPQYRDRSEHNDTNKDRSRTANQTADGQSLPPASKDVAHNGPRGAKTDGSEVEKRAMGRSKNTHTVEVASVPRDGFVRTWLHKLAPLTVLALQGLSNITYSDQHHNSSRSNHHRDEDEAKAEGAEQDERGTRAQHIQSPYWVGDMTAAAGDRTAAVDMVREDKAKPLMPGQPAVQKSLTQSHTVSQAKSPHDNVETTVKTSPSCASSTSTPSTVPPGGSESLSSFSDLGEETRSVMNPVPRLSGATPQDRPAAPGLTAEEWHACFSSATSAATSGTRSTKDVLGSEKDSSFTRESNIAVALETAGSSRDGAGVRPVSSDDSVDTEGTGRSVTDEATPTDANGLRDAQRLLAARTKAFYSGLGNVDSATRLDIWLHCLGVYDAARTAAQRADVYEANTQLFDLVTAQWQSIFPLQEANFSRFAQQKSLVEKDVARTDRADDAFAATDSPKVVMMRQVLMAHLMLNFDMGYWQGMSDVCAVVVRQTELPVMAFVCFSALLHRHLRGSFSADPERGMPSRLRQIQLLLRHFSPTLYGHLQKLHAADLSICLRWLLMLFKREFAYKDTVRLWDVIVTCPYTENFEIFVAVGLLKALSTQIKENIDSHEALLRFINNMPHSKMSVQSVIHAAHDFYDEVCMEISLLTSASGSDKVAHVTMGATTSPRLIRRPTLQEVIDVLVKVDGSLPY